MADKQPLFDEKTDRFVAALRPETLYALYRDLRDSTEFELQYENDDPSDPEEAMRELVWKWYYNQLWMVCRDAGFPEEEIDKRCCSFR